MSEPRTKAGRNAAKYDPYWLDTILAIEAEAQRLTVERLRAGIQHAFDSLNAASDKMMYGDSVEDDLLDAHATLDSLLTVLAREETGE